MSSERPQRIVIVGGGFGGINTYLQLHRLFHKTDAIEITMVNPTDYFGFTPLIHEVATGNLLMGGITQSLRNLPRCCLDQFVLGKAEEVDCTRQVVRVRGIGKPGDPNVPADDVVEIDYDYLVLAMGSKTNFLDVPGAREHAHELNEAAHARMLKNHILERFEHAHTLQDTKQQAHELSFVVVGGGPTGVEIVGELADFVEGIVTQAYPRLRGISRILLVERGDRLLKKGIAPWFSKRATEILQHKKRVYTLYNTAVEEVTTDGVVTDKGFVKSKTVIWTAGVAARMIAFHGEHDVECQEKSCRIRVNDYLQIAEHKNIFVVGDQAWVCDREQHQPYPMRAQFAVREGKCAGVNIARMIAGRELKKFSFTEKGMIVSLGKGGALAEIYGIRFSGFLAWFIYRTVYLFSMVGWRTRLRTMLEWTLNLFLPRDMSKI